MGFQGDEATAQQVASPDGAMVGGQPKMITVYPDITRFDNLTKTFTNFETVPQGQVVASASSAAGWTAIQHFPAAATETAGVAGTG
jgi:hypothetical protein